MVIKILMLTCKNESVLLLNFRLETLSKQICIKSFFNSVEIIKSKQGNISSKKSGQ